MFRPVSLSIIRSLALYTQQHIQVMLTACQQAVSITCMTYTQCCLYSTRLLMMSRETGRNMQSSIPKINLRNQCIFWFYYKNISKHVGDAHSVFTLHVIMKVYGRTLILRSKLLLIVIVYSIIQLTFIRPMTTINFASISNVLFKNSLSIPFFKLILGLNTPASKFLHTS